MPDSPMAYDTFLYNQKKVTYWDYKFCYPFNHATTIKVRNEISICPSVFPIKVNSVPFYTQLAKQITAQINKTVGQKIANKYEYFQKSVESGWHKGKPYYFRLYHVLTTKSPELRYTEIVRDVYLRDYLKIQLNGYSYGALIPWSKETGVQIPPIFIRWESCCLDYEYIEPGDGVDVDSKKIRFTICDKLPESVANILIDDATNNPDCLAWIGAMCNMDMSTGDGSSVLTK